MEMVSTNDFKTGLTIYFENEIYLVMEFMHVKPGKGGAFVRTKLRNLRSGGIIDYTFNAGIKVGKAMIDRIDMQYIYNTGTHFVFMNNDSYEQIEIIAERLTSEKEYLTEGQTAQIVSCEGELLGVNLPDKVVLEVAKADPAVKGDTKTNAMKDAILVTGKLIKVPMFIEEGERIIINTSTGEYVSREK